MQFSLDRNQFVAKKLGILNGDTILDIGCRDMVLKRYLKGNFKYKGLDFQVTQQLEENNDLINHNLENGLPKDLGKYDIINALDVLEHLENIHDIFQDLFVHSNNQIIIALPNIGYYRFRLSFLFNGILSKKYTFNKNKTDDRHRWIPNYYTIQEFVNHNINKKWIVKKKILFLREKETLYFFILKKF
ncbi:class I SAM-dependent methyltransferase [Candidatus Pelagibacter bacterium nBUS_30]|uniref:class I SAM-dependent methyltransferase n=1 Tax=Candidatus Pelagibacter bacterium nBUS_30 TaxID=3374191 RepID=UPI003EBA886D